MGTRPATVGKGSFHATVGKGSFHHFLRRTILLLIVQVCGGSQGGDAARARAKNRQGSRRHDVEKVQTRQTRLPGRSVLIEEASAQLILHACLPFLAISTHVHA